MPMPVYVPTAAMDATVTSAVAIAPTTIAICIFFPACSMPLLHLRYFVRAHLKYSLAIAADADALTASLDLMYLRVLLIQNWALSQMLISGGFGLNSSFVQ